MTPRHLVTLFLTMVAFAANSILCRLALRASHIDPWTFSSLRLLGGAVVLLVVASASAGWRTIEWRPVSSLFLLVYVFAFSCAYRYLPAGSGALLLFGTVQLAMTLWGLLHRESFSWLKGTGIVLACAGMGALLLPGASQPSPGAALLMCLAGVGWAAYSIVGRRAQNAVAATAGNFALTLPAVAVVMLCTWQHAHADSTGVLLALACGGLASGVAYVLWYRLVPGLPPATASTVQLSVPGLALLGGALLLGEPVNGQMLLAVIVTLAGIGLVICADRMLQKMP